MSKVDMSQFGIQGVTYHFSDKIRYFQRSDGEKFRCNVPPGQLSPQEMDNLSEFLVITSDELLEALLDLNDALKQESGKTQRGTQNHVEVTWDNAVKYNAKGDATGLDWYIVGKLIANDFIRVDDSILKPENNIAKIVTNESLTRYVLSRLEEVNASSFWGTHSQSLVRDHILSLCPVKNLGSTYGLLPVKNGILDLNTMELTQSDDVYLSSANVAYDPNAECPNIHKLLNNMFLPEQKEMVLSILGAAISGRSAQYILCLSGQGRNGKSILRQILVALLGELYTAEKIERIHDNFVNQAFIGRRLIWQTEVSSKRAFTDVLKDVTGGTTINVQYKYKNGGLQIELQTVVVLDTNHPPSLENSRAIEERLRFIDMPKIFVHQLTGDPREILLDRDLADGWQKEIPGFLNVLAKYAQYFLQHGRLMVDLGGGLEAYNNKADSLGCFIEEWCDVSDAEQVTIKTFCNYYKKYAMAHNVSALTDSQIRYQLQKEFGFKVKGMTVYGIRPRKQQIFNAEASADSVV